MQKYFNKVIISPEMLLMHRPRRRFQSFSGRSDTCTAEREVKHVSFIVWIHSLGFHGPWDMHAHRFGCQPEKVPPYIHRLLSLIKITAPSDRDVPKSAKFTRKGSRCSRDYNDFFPCQKLPQNVLQTVFHTGANRRRPDKTQWGLWTVPAFPLSR